MAKRRLNRRQIQAEATRQDILAASRWLFAEHGYAATSMSVIAEKAGTAVQTIYDSVGPKRAILLALNDVIDEEAGVGETWRRIAETTDPKEMVALGVKLTRRFNERCGDVIGALMSGAPSEPDVADALQVGSQRHRDGCLRLARRLAEFGGLKPELSGQRAGDIFAVLTWVPIWRQFTRDHGWSFDECEAWLTETLVTLLLREEV